MSNLFNTSKSEKINVWDNLSTLFGSRNTRVIKKLKKTLKTINNQEALLQKLTDTELQQKSHELRVQIAQGQAMESLLPEAYAIVREAFDTSVRHASF